MVLAKESEHSETAAAPRPEVAAEMQKLNEDLAKAGVLLAAERLQPSAKGVRVRFEGKQRTVIDGPFTEAKELVAGFWIWQVRSMDEAIEWLKRAPFDGGTELEIRPIFEWDQISEQLTPELKQRWERTQEELAGKT
jgi:hypothetical protein